MTTPQASIDLRSDTVTLPSAAMKDAMLRAPLGDDVYGEDPTVRELEERVAALCGKEAGLFCPSGTMSNQIALGLHLRPGDEVLGHRDNHVYVWEGGGIARHWQASYKALSSANPQLSRQMLELDDFREQLNPDDPHYPRTRLICLENTLNRGGGRIFPLAETRRIGAWATAQGLRMHLDGARLWNAAAASATAEHEWVAPFDTASLCFSKGLGCPVGSVLVGPQEALRREGVRLRKLLGGGMRQAGMLAAAGLYALEHNRTRLAEDHTHARLLYEAVQAHPLLTPEFVVETNIVWFCLQPQAPWDAYALAQKLREKGILLTAFNKTTLRAVTHLGISRQTTERVCHELLALR